METRPKPVVTGYPAAAQGPPYATAVAGDPARPAAAYPYPAPPFYPPPPAPAAYRPAYSPTGALFVRRLIIFCVSIFLALGLVTFVIWLVLRPRLPDFSLASASVSSFQLSAGPQLSADFNLTFSVRNGNRKMGILYDNVQAAVFYGAEPIADTSLPPFYQGKGNSTVVPARLAAVANYVHPDLAGAMDKEKSSGGVTFHVRLLSSVRFRAGIWRTRLHVMTVTCDDVRIGFSNATATATAGLLIGPPRPCRVYL